MTSLELELKTTQYLCSWHTRHNKNSAKKNDCICIRNHLYIMWEHRGGFRKWQFSLNLLTKNVLTWEGGWLRNKNKIPLCNKKMVPKKIQFECKINVVIFFVHSLINMLMKFSNKIISQLQQIFDAKIQIYLVKDQHGTIKWKLSNEIFFIL